MAEAFGLVAAAAVPVGLVAWRLGRRTPPPPLPVAAVDDPVFALAYLLLFCLHPLAVVTLGQVAGGDSTWRSVVGTLLAAPLLLAGWLVFAGVRRGWLRAVAVGVAAWLVVSPPVYAVHAAAEWATGGVGAQEHPLVKLIAAGGGTAVLAASVAVATPFAEEVLFRGLLLGWLVRKPRWDTVPIGMAVLVAATTASVAARFQVIGFVALLLVGQMLLAGRPTAAAVWATSTLFAVVHAGVWPTPVPLFLLGLALGWVAVRTGGVLAGTVAHGLFNLVSLVFLVRG